MMKDAIMQLLGEIEELLSQREAERVRTVDQKSEKPNAYNFEILAQQPEKFKDELMKFGRVPYAMSQGSVIRVCRPLLCFEQKDDNFLEVRYATEKSFWEKKLGGDCKDMDLVAKVVLDLF
ncbi:hypothetical protein [Vibrio crassostreae]|uniref:hypothetical protein n=1 Tax=Vibrio crassostreae TaxID=246167 RepID=UPI001B317015|nr:hypothetical protein [Vibrio crassostreae]